LKQSLKGSRPSDAARLLAVADAIGRAALELTPSGATGAFGLNPTAAPNIRVVIKRDAQSDEVRRLSKLLWQMLCASGKNAPPFPSSTSQEGHDERNVSLRLCATSPRLLTLASRLDHL
jgi:hypothetical protein